MKAKPARTHPRITTLLLLCFCALMLAPRQSLAWGEPHHAITSAALEVLPAWQKEILGEELAPLAAAYCLIPDKVHTDRVNGRFAMMDSHPGEIYLLKLHLPDP